MGWIQNVLFGKDRDVSKDDILELAQRHKFSSYLPWEAYDPEKRAYHNNDDTLGFIWECSPLAFAGENTCFTLEGLFRLGLPENSVMQFILYADKYIEPYVEAYRAMKTRDLDIVRKATAHYAGFYLAGVNGMDVFMRTPLRNFRLFVTVKFPADAKNLNLKDIQNSIGEILGGAGLHPDFLEPRDLVDWMRRLLNDTPSRNNGHYDEKVSLRKQMIFADTVIDKTLSHLRIGGRCFRCTTAKTFPKTVDPLQTNELFGGFLGVISDSNQMLTPFLYTLNIVFQDLKTKLHTKCNLVLQQQGFGSFAPALVRRKDEYLAAVDALERGAVYVKIIPTLWVWDEEEKKTSESLIRAKRMWEQQGYVMQEDKGILPALFIMSLPMGLYVQGGNLDVLERDFITSADAVAPVLPIQADFCGGGYPVLLLMGRKGQPVPLDIFDKRANSHNFLVLASTGVGKSFFLNFLALNYFSCGGGGPVPGALIRIIDIGGSYKRLTKIVGGRYLDFDKDSNICLNPFTNVKDPVNDLPVISAIALQMCYSSTGIIPDDAAETGMSLLKMAVQWSWRLKGREASIDDIFEYLRSFPGYETKFGADGYGETMKFRELARTLAFNMSEFTSQGIYGRWFNGPSTFDISRDEWVVLELEKLRAVSKSLFAVVTMQVVNEVTQDLYLSDRSRPRLIIFDEAYIFLNENKSKALAEVVEEGYRRSRKYGGSFSILSQSCLDLQQFGPVGNVIWANSAFKFFLQSPDFDRAKAEKLIEYDEFGMKILKSIQSRKGSYSEIFMDTPFGAGPVRLAVDPYSYYLYTSDAKEISEMESMVETGMTYDRAINEMIRKYRSGRCER